jgi:hypothetical protein
MAASSETYGEVIVAHDLTGKCTSITCWTQSYSGISMTSDGRGNTQYAISINSNKTGRLPLQAVPTNQAGPAGGSKGSTTKREEELLFQLQAQARRYQESKTQLQENVRIAKEQIRRLGGKSALQLQDRDNPLQKTVNTLMREKRNALKGNQNLRKMLADLKSKMVDLKRRTAICRN